MTTLWDTTGTAVVRALAAERRTGGAVTSGIALTLVVVVDQEDVEEAEEAATVAASRHPMRLLVVVRRQIDAPVPRLDAEVTIGGRLGPGESVVLRMYGRLALHAESVTLPLLAPDAPAQIRRWMDRGLSGLRVFVAGHTTAQDVRLDDPRSFSAWECAVDAGLPICVQLRAPALGQLQSMLERFPGARVLLDHMARPAADDAAPLLALAKYENLYLKLTTHNVRELPQGFFARVVKSYGAARIAWGSNYPAAEGTLGALLADARAALAALNTAERDWIFSRTAKSFYATLA